MTEPLVLADDQLERLADLIAERSTASPLLTAEQAGKLLNVPATWLLAEARAERVPHSRLGRYVRFDSAELREWASNGHHRGPRTRSIA
jgi:excisionase family DNA binding protein